jgi:hypothetical protein
MSTAASKLAAWLVERSACMLVEAEDCDRYAEQWLADLEDRRTPLRKLLFAFGVWRASAALRRELEKAPLPPEAAVVEWPTAAAVKWIIKFEDSPSRVRFDERLRFLRWLKASPDHVAECLRIMQVSQLLHEEILKRLKSDKEESLKPIKMDCEKTFRTEEGNKG